MKRETNLFPERNYLQRMFLHFPLQTAVSHKFPNQYLNTECSLASGLMFGESRGLARGDNLFGY